MVKIINWYKPNLSNEPMKNRHKRYQFRFVAIISTLLLLAGCLPGRFAINARIDNHQWNRRASGHRYKMKRVPPGHMPPPGQCRIWYPGIPPGHQPPPGNCAVLSRHVPPDAWLIVG